MFYGAPNAVVSASSSFDPRRSFYGSVPPIPQVAPRHIPDVTAGLSTMTSARREILPRAIHAARTQGAPERAGAAIAEQAAMGAVTRGFSGLGLIGSGAGCTSKGAQATQATLSVVGALTAAIGGAVGGKAGTGVATAGTALSAAGQTWAGVCQISSQQTQTGQAVLGQTNAAYAALQAQMQGSAPASQPAAAPTGTAQAVQQAVLATRPVQTPDQVAAAQAQYAQQYATSNPNAASAAHQALDVSGSAHVQGTNTAFIVGGVIAAAVLGFLILK